jgi:hypothetical protein
MEQRQTLSLDILVTCFARLSMEKLQYYANMSFMLYVPYSTLFCAGKCKQGPRNQPKLQKNLA